jgi:hypothetical protein
MARPRKHTAQPIDPGSVGSDHREAYLERIRSRLELYSAKEVAGIVGIDQDAVYLLGLPGFNPGERRHRWDGYTLADYLSRHKTGDTKGTHGMAAYLSALSSVPALLTASRVSEILGLPSDEVPSLGFPSFTAASNRVRYAAPDLASWLDSHRIEDGDAG